MSDELKLAPCPFCGNEATWVINQIFCNDCEMGSSPNDTFEMAVEKFSPSLYNSLGIFLPLIAVNCAILGGSLFMQQRAFPNIGEAAVYAFGSGIGWLLAIVGLAAIREKMMYNDTPKPLRGLGMAFIITALMGIAFQAFSGLSI